MKWLKWFEMVVMNFVVTYLEICIRKQKNTPPFVFYQIYQHLFTYFVVNLGSI